MITSVRALWSGIGCLVLSLSFSSLPLLATPGEGVLVRPLMEQLPLSFEPNRGQFSSDAVFGARGDGFLVLLEPDAIRLKWNDRTGTDPSREPEWLQISWLGGNSSPALQAEEISAKQTSYFRGSHSQDWQLGLSTFLRVRYRDVYPGIDLVVYGERDHLEYDFILAPGAAPDQIKVSFAGASGAVLSSRRELSLDMSRGTVTQFLPAIFQEVNGEKLDVVGSYRMLEEEVVTFDIGPYDRTLPLNIDPVLLYSSYLGGSQGDVPGGVAVDNEGNFYVMGSTGSDDFPIRDAFQAEWAGGGSTNGDLYVTKFSPSGREVIYSTYIGGEGTDVGHGIAVDDQGRAYLVGTTFSDDFPSTSGAFQEECSGQCPFVVRLSADGNMLEYATFIGRGAGLGVAVDSLGQAVLVGNTSRADFPVKSAFQSENAGSFDAFIAKLNASGGDLVFSTFLGGSAEESLGSQMDVALDPDGNILLVGATRSEDFPLMNPVQNFLQGGDDVFFSKLDSTGQLLSSTYLGGAEDDDGWAVAADVQGNIYVSGETHSADFPVANALQSQFGGGVFGDAFLAKLPSAGGSLLFSTYLGGDGADAGADLAVDALGRAVLVGSGSTGFPLADPLFEFDGVNNFVLKIEEDGSSLVYSTAFGGGDNDISVATHGRDVYFAGNSSSGNDPILHAFQPRRVRFGETFFAQISDAGEIYFAQFGNGPGAVSEILLTNPSSLTAATATLAFRDDDGLPVELNLAVSSGTAEGTSPLALTSELTVNIEPLGMVKVTTDGAGDELVAGSVTVAHDIPVGGVIRFNLMPVGTSGVGESELVRGFITPARRTKIRTGVAIFNPEESQTGIRMRLRDRSGQEIPGGLRTTAIPAKGHLAQFIDELFPSADLENFEGTLTVEATSLNSLIAATALELGNQAGQFTTLPITPIP